MVSRSATWVGHRSQWLGWGLIDCGWRVFRWRRVMFYWSLRSRKIEPGLCICGRREWKFVAYQRYTGRRCVLGAIVSLMTHRYSSLFCQPIKHPGCSFTISPRARSFSNAEGPEGPDECNTNAIAIGLELAGTSICDGIFHWCIKGP